MWPNAEHFWHIGAAAGDIKYGVPRGRNFPSFLQVRQVSPGALDRLQRHDTEASLLDLGTQFVGAVTVAGEAAGKERRHDAGADCLIQQHREGGITSPIRSRSTPSSRTAHREIAAAATIPPGRTTRAASRRHCTRAAEVIKW